eukprot:356116-Chlamydomonas_euryale.AAC.5
MTWQIPCALPPPHTHLHTLPGPATIRADGGPHDRRRCRGAAQARARLGERALRGYAAAHAVEPGADEDDLKGGRGTRAAAVADAGG